MIQDRIVELRRVPASSLTPHPLNWRSHPQNQQKIVRQLLQGIGFAGALLVRELVDGTLQLIDGHLRAEIASDAEVPVLILNLSDKETELLLLTFDAVGGVAKTDEVALQKLTDSLTDELGQYDDLLRKLRLDCAAATDLLCGVDVDLEIDASYQLLVECNSERQQRNLYDTLTGDGWHCRVLTL